ncbi:MAG: hypothetical protein KAS87_02045 [Candidatus Omnitrophica bacterium]|nr:hypothetical protein [Candidatus Omnitrophota bacterium]
MLSLKRKLRVVYEKCKSSGGLTLVEIIVALLLGVMVFGGILMLWEFSQRAWHIERTRSKNLAFLEMSMERIKKDVRLSSSDKMFFNPVSAATYEAISLPLAVDDDGDGFIEVDGVTKMIDWDETVIYHLYTSSSETQLRKTIFNSRVDLSDAQRQTQIDDVVTNGQPIVSTPNYANWNSTPGVGTRVLISAPAISLEITPQRREFDNYNSSTKKSANVSFGSISLTSGYHTLKLKIANKNNLSTDYALGIDCIRLTPSGSDREGEDYLHITHPDASAGISAFVGATPAFENMLSFGSWSSDSQLSFNSHNIDDFLTLRFYNDVWRESNFLSGNINGTTSEYTNDDGAGGTMSREDIILCLIGNQENWDVAEQTKNSTVSSQAFAIGDGHITYRNIISQEYIETSGRLVRVKFCAGNTDHLKIDSAYICARSEIAGQGQDCAAPSARITFSGANGVDIPMANFVWSDWIDMGENFNEDRSYFASLYIPLVGAGDSNSISYWSHPTETSCYWQTGDHSLVDSWGGTGTATNNLYGVGFLEVSYIDNGIYTSKIYDTTMADPQFSQIRWTLGLNNPSIGAILKVRSNDSEAVLAADVDWSDEHTIDTGSISGSASIAAIAGGRYVQFQAVLAPNAIYTMTPVLRDVALYWPGNTVACDLSGYFTLRPNYGIFSVEIDGKPLHRGLEIGLSISEEVYKKGTIVRSLNAELKPRNTGK